ncbi:MAG: preprotein translocase subunit SecG [Deltaproteobacteria bacterium]|nr:preprotein translocase subunit SecG [Deltaproteobacteria bacterium]
MQNLILTLHVVVCVTLVILVLLQAGKEGMGVIFGGGSGSVFGSSGAGGILTKLTTFMAVLFIATCLSYNLVTSTKVAQESTILDIKLEEMPAPVEPADPAQPAAPSVAPPVAPSVAPAVAPPAEPPAAPPAR